MNHQNAVGHQIRKVRSNAGLSQEALAARCNVLGWDLSRGTLSKIEARIRRLNDAELKILATALKCKLDDLYSDDPQELLKVVRQGKD